MRINFLKNTKSGVSPENACHVYNLLLEEHLAYTKLIHERLALYTKRLNYCGMALLALISFYFAQVKFLEITTYLLMGSVAYGIGVMLSCLWPIFQDVIYDQKIAYIVVTGKKIEEEYPSIVPLTLFNKLENPQSYRSLLISRFLPFSFVFLETATIGAILSSDVGLVATVSIGLLCGGVVAVSIFLISKAVKQNRKFDVSLE
jgi:hypothetical protein